MSLELVRDVSREHPDLLPTNLGRTCYRHTQLLVEKLRARGQDAYLMAKSPGEGQYTPPGFQPRTVTGLDGKPYPCSGVSHDAIWCAGNQFDTIASANEYDQPIYRKNTEPFWSFDPSDGAQIIAVGVWNQIPTQYWRANNPPLNDSETPIPAPEPTPIPVPPSAPTYPSYEALGGDEGGKRITRQLEADYNRVGRALDGDCGAWQQRVSYDFLTGICKTVEESIAKHRAGWCAALGIPVE